MADPTSLAAQRPIVKMPQHSTSLVSCSTGSRERTATAGNYRVRQRFHRYPLPRSATPTLSRVALGERKTSASRDSEPTQTGMALVGYWAGAGGPER